MRQRMLLIFLLLFAFSVANADSLLQQIKHRGYIKVALYGHDAPPYIMYDASKKPYGVDIEIVNRIAQALHVGVRYNVSASYFDELVEQINQGKDDLAISELFVTPERAEKVAFTSPYVLSAIDLLVNRARAIQDTTESFNSNSYNSPKVLIGVIDRSVYVRLAETMFPRAQLIKMSSAQELYDTLEKGKLTAIFTMNDEIAYYLQHDPSLELFTRVVPVQHTTQLIAIAARYHNDQFTAWLNVVLRLLVANEMIDQFKQEYIK